MIHLSHPCQTIPWQKWVSARYRVWKFTFIMQNKCFTSLVSHHHSLFAFFFVLIFHSDGRWYSHHKTGDAWYLYCSSTNQTNPPQSVNHKKSTDDERKSSVGQAHPAARKQIICHDVQRWIVYRVLSALPTTLGHLRPMQLLVGGAAVEAFFKIKFLK